MKTRLFGLLVLALTALALAVPQSASATQSWSRLMLSRDGQHWTPHLDAPLFGKKFVWVPGTQKSRTFYVRNQSGEAARLRVTVRVTNGEGLLGHSGFRMAVRTRNGHWHQIRRPGRQRVAHLTMGKGKIAPVTVRVRFFTKAGNQTMDGHLRFVTRVRLSEKG